MTILFGWNRFRLKSFTFQELNLPELEQFPNATIQVAQSYFHLFYIPVFPMGKRYDLVMNKELYHVPPSLMKMIDPQQIKVRGKWYAWLLPILAVVIGLSVMFYDMYKTSTYNQQSDEIAELERQFFDKPAVGDLLTLSNGNDLELHAEVCKVEQSFVTLFVDLMGVQDDELFANIEQGISDMHPDTLRMLIQNRNDLETTSEYNDSLQMEHPDQPLLRKLLTFELYGYPIKYEFVKMSPEQYKNLKKSIGDSQTKKKALKVPGFGKITKDRLYVYPEWEYEYEGN